jgi:hypothetical protein
VVDVLVRLPQAVSLGLGFRVLFDGQQAGRLGGAELSFEQR